MLRDYLEVGIPAAEAQWRRVLQRAPRPRQEAFLPVETLLCVALFHVLDPHRFGGGNIDTAPRLLHELARLCCRPPGSLTNKMLNLDGSRPNSAAGERELWVELWSDQERLHGLYRAVLEGARRAGIGVERLPDFLGLEGAGTLYLLGQEELEPGALDRTIEVRLRDLGDHGEVGERRTARAVEQLVRVGQHRFARGVLENYGHRCGFCGFQPPRRTGLLVASHIKPWADSDARERLDLANGVAACNAHDAAFDGFLVTVNGGLAIRRAPPLEVLARDGPGERLYGAGTLLPRLLTPPGGRAPGASYLAWHNTRFYERSLEGLGG